MSGRYIINFKELESDQKLRGGYYTPEPIVEFLTRWAVTTQTRTILEPSCGDGRFLACLSNILSRGPQSPDRIKIDAVELVSDEAELAEYKAQYLAAEGIHARVYCGDFLRWIESIPSQTTWDAILGNPPYIRYQYFDKTQRQYAEEIFKKANVAFTMLTNAWVPFVLASVMHLSPGGRIAMVIPSEICYIIHAQGLRRFLEQELEYIRLLHLRDIVFDDTLQGTLLLLGIKRVGRGFYPLTLEAVSQYPLLAHRADRDELDFKICDLDGIEELNDLDPDHLSTQDATGNSLSGHWMLALLDQAERLLLQEIASLPAVKGFSDIADVTIGIVTGANNYFCVSNGALEKYGLAEIARPMLARSELMKGIAYLRRDHEENALRGKPVFFLEFPSVPKYVLPEGMREYVAMGEGKGLHKRYKCRIRDPWYCVPYVWASQLAMLKRCHHYPRLVVNTLGAYSTDTAYRITLKPEYAKRGKDFAFCFINSYTLLLAELAGRHYAGGVLELVPSEIRSLRVPPIRISKAEFASLDKLIRHGADTDDVLDYADKIVLVKGLGLSQETVTSLRLCCDRLRKRRQRCT